MSDTKNGRKSASEQEILAATPRSSGGEEAQVGVFVLTGLITFIIVSVFFFAAFEQHYVCYGLQALALYCPLC